MIKMYYMKPVSGKKIKAIYRYGMDDSTPEKMNAMAHDFFNIIDAHTDSEGMYGKEGEEKNLLETASSIESNFSPKLRQFFFPKYCQIMNDFHHITSACDEPEPHLTALNSSQQR